MDQKLKYKRAKTQGEKFHDTGFGFLRYGNKSMGNKRKIDKLDYIKIKNFCASGAPG